ncbi:MULTISPECIES: hypothetical protein [unclassified Streptomyces]|uniref:hypothetical protein n=1 Tax=unclassified Streptomyces TaxID=2593676 RepID=UPI0004C0BC9A|nr:hypothetical protein [Streptomyces sp. NRRL WC-3626]
MSTTRHHINRQRRRQARETRPAGPPQGAPGEAHEPRPTASAGPARGAGGRGRASGTAVPSGRATDPDAGGDEKGARVRARRPAGLLVLCALTLLLGGFAGWAHAKAGALRDEPARRNTALSDPARTGEIKGQTAEAVDALFSYDHTDPGALEKAADGLLTGQAVEQHRTLLADVRERADAQKAVITTTVTDSAVERIDGDRARVLVYADQSSVSTAGSTKKAKGAKDAQDEGVYAGAMLAVDVVRRDGRWLVSGIDTFGR